MVNLLPHQRVETFYLKGASSALTHIETQTHSTAINMFRACKPSVPRSSIEKTLPLHCPPTSVHKAAQPLKCLNPPHKTQTIPAHEHSLVKKPLLTEAVPKENEQPSAVLPQDDSNAKMDIASLEMGWEYQTILESPLTPEEMSEDLSREIRPERIVHPDDDPLLTDMFALFAESQPNE